MLRLPGILYSKTLNHYYGDGSPDDFAYYSHYLQIGFFPFCIQRHWHSRA